MWRTMLKIVLLAILVFMVTAFVAQVCGQPLPPGLKKKVSTPKGAEYESSLAKVSSPAIIIVPTMFTYYHRLEHGARSLRHWAPTRTFRGLRFQRYDSRSFKLPGPNTDWVNLYTGTGVNIHRSTTPIPRCYYDWERMEISAKSEQIRLSSHLSARHREILELLAMGMTMTETSMALGITEKTLISIWQDLLIKPGSTAARI